MPPGKVKTPDGYQRVAGIILATKEVGSVAIILVSYKSWSGPQKDCNRESRSVAKRGLWRRKTKGGDMWI
jgi:hypothetical protein